MGMHISRVPPNCLPFLQEPLLKEKQKAIETGRVDIVKKIQSISRQLDDACLAAKKKSNNSSKFDSSSSSSSFISNSSKSSTQSNYVRKLLEGEFKELADPQLISQIIPILKKEKKNAIERGKYHQAKILTDMINEFRNRSAESICESENVEKYMSYQSQLARAEIELKNTRDYYDHHKRLLMMKHMKAVSDLKNLHEEQIIDFERTWPSELPPSHRKLSKAALEMRTKEKRMVHVGMFDEAEEARDLADWLEFKDLNEQKMRFEIDFNRELLHLKQAQEKELNYMNFRYENRMDELKAEEERELLKMEQLIQNIRHKIEPEDRSLLIHEKRFSMGLPDLSETRAKNMNAAKIAYSQKRN